MSNFEIIQIKSGEIDKYKEDIVRLWKDNLANGSSQRFSWLYKTNPNGPVVTWLAKDIRTGKFVACNSLYSREILFNGRKLKIGIAIDFAVSKEYRVFGPALLIEKAIVSDSTNLGFDCIFAWPSLASLGVFLRAGYKKLADVSLWVKILKTDNKIAALIKAPFLAKMLSSMANSLFFSLDWLSGFFYQDNFVGAIGDRCNAGTNYFKKDWTQDLKVSVVKNSENLNWRYLQCPYEDCKFFYLIDKEDELIKGYIVYTINNDNVIIYDIDLWSESYFGALLNKFSFFMRQSKMQSLILTKLDSLDFDKHLNKAGFFRRAVKRPCVIHYNQEKEFSEGKDLLIQANWSLFDGDMDL